MPPSFLPITLLSNINLEFVNFGIFCNNSGIYTKWSRAWYYLGESLWGVVL